MSAFSAATLLDWQPGDGVRCTYASAAPSELPCGPPVKTRVITVTPARQRPRHIRKPLCLRHSGEVEAPGDVLKHARKAAAEQLIMESYDRYLQLVAEAVAAAIGNSESSSSVASTEVKP